MAKILKPKIKANGLMDSFEMAALKSVSERTLAPVVGNGNVKSGVVKLVGAGLLSSVSPNKHVGLLSSAIIIDGFEDIVTGLLGGNANVGGGSAEGAW